MKIFRNPILWFTFLALALFSVMAVFGGSDAASLPGGDGGVAPTAKPGWFEIFEAAMAVVVAVIVLARLIVKLTPTPADDTILEKIVTALKHIGLNVKVLIFALLSSALLCTGCGTLDKTGVYAGDQVLYESEVVIPTSYELIHTFVAWEKDNRAVLAKWPEIKRSADAMRAGAKQWIASANALHDAYQVAPTPENGAALQRALAILRTALNEAAQYMAQAANAKANAPNP